LRDLVWLTLLRAMASVWWAEHSALSAAKAENHELATVLSICRRDYEKLLKDCNGLPVDRTD